MLPLFIGKGRLPGESPWLPLQQLRQARWVQAVLCGPWLSGWAWAARGLRYLSASGRLQGGGGGAHSTKAKLSLMGSQQVVLSLSQLLEKNNIYSTRGVFVVSSQHKYFECVLCARLCVGTGEGGL